MKAQIGLYFDVTTAEELRVRAANTGTPISELADLLVRFGLARIKDEAIREWNAKRSSVRGRLAGGLRKDERAALNAIDVLRAKDAPAWRFSLTDVASGAGLKLTNAFWALKSLEGRGIVAGMEMQEVDRWGRPIKSFWGLLVDKNAHAARLSAAAPRHPTEPQVFGL